MLVNLTNHPIVIYRRKDVHLLEVRGRDIYVTRSNSKPILEIPPATPDQVLNMDEDFGCINAITKNGVDVPVYAKINTEVDLPPSKPGVYYIVPAQVAQTFPERNDFLTIHKSVKDYDTGRIVGCLGLRCY